MSGTVLLQHDKWQPIYLTLYAVNNLLDIFVFKLTYIMPSSLCKRTSFPIISQNYKMVSHRPQHQATCLTFFYTVAGCKANWDSNKVT